MDRRLFEQYSRLIESVSALPEVLSIGKSGGAELPQPGEGDIDLFIFCEAVPDEAGRRCAEAFCDGVTGCRVAAGRSRHWGTCDFVYFDGAEVCLMYFTIEEMNAEIDAVLSGERPGKEDNEFYPTGRCASFLSMHILLDRRGYIAAMQEKLRIYSLELAIRLTDHHLRSLDDTEDLERAVARRDALFYHFALDLALDHFLQALFAMNACYFPSRKRSIQHIQGFSRAPEQCAARLLEVLELGGKAETIARSYEDFTRLFRELSALGYGSMSS
jgi:hypothetical protein